MEQKLKVRNAQGIQDPFPRTDTELPGADTRSTEAEPKLQKREDGRLQPAMTGRSRHGSLLFADVALATEGQI